MSTDPSLSKSATKIVRTQCNQLFAAMIPNLELIKIKTALNHFAIKNKLFLKANQIMFAELQNYDLLRKVRYVRNKGSKR